MMDRQMAVFARLHAQEAGPRLRHDHPGTNSFYDITYATVSGYRPLTLDLHIPSKGSGPFPALVWVHGGAWSGGHRGMGHAIKMIQHGYAIAAIQYRLSGEAKYPAQLHDVKGAVRWLRANAAPYQLDPGRFVGWGASAGATLVNLVALTAHRPDLEGDVGGNLDQSSGLQAVIDFFGVTDFFAMDSSSGRMPSGDPVTGLLGYRISERPDEARRAMPISHVHQDAPPFLILHGDVDPLVPHAQSEAMHKALVDAGCTARLITVPGAVHEDPAFWTDATLGEIARFLEQALHPPAPTASA
jgi:acetyl esterase/lipase